MQHVIERGIAPPPATTVYPFAEMEVGDSFLTSKARNLVSAAASDYGRRHGRQYSVRKDGDGFRVWRTA